MNGSHLSGFVSSIQDELTFQNNSALVVKTFPWGLPPLLLIASYMHLFSCLRLKFSSKAFVYRYR